jgi:hypothetical protein
VDIRFYLEHPSVPPDLAVVWGTSTARVLQGKAEELRDEAKLKYSVDGFHFNLYTSLLYYRCALYAYREVLSLSKVSLAKRERALERLEAARVEAVLCEEHRVVIMTPLLGALKGVENWIERLAELPELEIRQAYDAELMIPKFLRDLALGLLACRDGETTKGLAKMLAVMQELEKHLKEAMLFGDPNYLSGTYWLMSQICAQSGMGRESLEYSRRAEPSYYKNLLQRG